jgi:hypothetical protein
MEIGRLGVKRLVNLHRAGGMMTPSRTVCFTKWRSSEIGSESELQRKMRESKAREGGERRELWMMGQLAGHP